MNNYISNLKNLVCTSTSSKDCQIDSFIKKVLRKEFWVVNGQRPDGTYLGQLGTRVHDFLVEDIRGDKSLTYPKYPSKSIDDNTTVLQRENSEDKRTLNNNPNFRPNMIEVLNTPFDHVERIVLQDLSEVMGLPDKANNYFKELFTFPADGDKKYNGGFAGFTMGENSMPGIYTEAVNDKFQPGAASDASANCNVGGFFIDSFTYTPFVDYSQDGEGGSPRIGVYSDQFLNDYNTGKYEDPDYQVDKFRHTLSSNLYELRNLKKDLEDAKVAFRNAITYIVDEETKERKSYQVYIYTLCEHLAELFAKLSNIRMSHEIYGLKHPHYKWEGILALDIWYNLLYREIDAKYPFDEMHMNLNPMQRRKYNGSGSVVMDDGKVLNLRSSGTCRWSGASSDAPGLEWMADETSDEYVYIWDANLWQDYYDNSEKIAKTRKECTTPRGVLAKVQRVVKELEYRWENNYLAQRDSDDDYEWFKQPGKVYSHWKDKSQFTKYVNLHLGAAYDAMQGKEYCELVGEEGTEDDSGNITYVKPMFSSLGDSQRNVLDKMMESGFKALVDAFAVIQNECLFNVYNSNANKVEEFDPAKANEYSQSQCAIALERVFSRIYKYLQFKSTTGETFQRHINIDSGYKYLTTESLKKSDHQLEYYFDDSDEGKKYLRYLKKLQYYLTSSAPGIGLTQNEKAVLGQFCEILSKETLGWLNKKWDLCPILQRAETRGVQISPRKLMSRGLVARAANDENHDPYYLYLDFTKNGYMSSGWTPRSNIEVPSNWTIYWCDDNRLRVELNDQVDGIDLSKIKFRGGNCPTYVYNYTDDQGSSKSITSKYSIGGYTLARSSSQLMFTSTQNVTTVDFGDTKSIIVYVAWNPEYILAFESDNSHYKTGESAGYMAPRKLADAGNRAPTCTFNHPLGKKRKFEYKNDSRWQDTSGYTSEEVYLYEFKNWSFSWGAVGYNLLEGDPIRINVFNLDLPPVIKMRAHWSRAYDVLKFNAYPNTLYCEVCISTAINRVVYPDHAPEIRDGNWRFYGWTVAEGDYLPGVDRNATVICGTESTPILCGDGTTPIICNEDEYDYDTPIDAYLVEHKTKDFNVIFKYMDENGIHAEHTESVQQNMHLPRFHIHNSYKSGTSTYTFRHWLLTSGNLTSSLTVLSDLVFVAVYDETKDAGTEDMDVVGPG